MKKSCYSLLLMLFVLCLSACSVQRDAVCGIAYVVAHRGGVSLGPENGLLAIGRALLLGVDAVEVDVRMSADGCIVLMHDVSVDRTTNGRGRVGDLTLSQLKSLSLLDGERGLTDESIPTLDEVLQFVVGRCRVLIEVKDCDNRGIEMAVKQVIDECSAWEWVSVQSFSDDVLKRFVALDVSFPLEKLFWFKLPFVPYIFDGTLCRFSLGKYEHVSSFNIYRPFARDGLVEQLHGAGKRVKVWGVRKGCARRVPEVDGIITDYPQCYLW